jgi:hypothetical protein
VFEVLAFKFIVVIVFEIWSGETVSFVLFLILLLVLFVWRLLFILDSIES